jgi:hypothetical protein
MPEPARPAGHPGDPAVVRPRDRVTGVRSVRPGVLKIPRMTRPTSTGPGARAGSPCVPATEPRCLADKSVHDVHEVPPGLGAVRPTALLCTPHIRNFPPLTNFGNFPPTDTPPPRNPLTPTSASSDGPGFMGDRICPDRQEILTKPPPSPTHPSVHPQAQPNHLLSIGTPRTAPGAGRAHADGRPGIPSRHLLSGSSAHLSMACGRVGGWLGLGLSMCGRTWLI